jgi:cellulose synthase/poly-beta-1,6-N-acetylglucosamine synthase-like glycosyltransferase
MWHLLFWGSLAIIGYTYFGYPALLYLIAKLRRWSSPVAGEAHDELPSVCLVISAYNEEAVIRQKLENSLALDYPSDRLTILVASDGSTDATVAIARDFEGVVVRHYPERRGKSAVLNDVVSSLDQDIVVFTDANASFAPDAIERMAVRFADPGIGCVVGKLRYVEAGSTSVGRGENIYWKYEALISRLESRLRSVLVANGSIFAIRRDLFRELYPDVANDFQIPTDVSSQGRGVVYEPRALAEEHTTVYWQEEFDRKVRIVLRGLTGFALMRHRIRGLRRWQFWSHKLLRWMVGFFLFLALGANVVLAGGSFFFTITLAAQIVFYFAALNGWMAKGARRPRRAFYIPFYFTMVNASAAVAIIKFLVGQRQRVWDKAESTRLAPVPDAEPSSPTPDDASSRDDFTAKVAKS